MNDTPTTQSTRWFTDGPTMVYAPGPRVGFWLINLILYALLNMFILRLHQGVWSQLQGPYHSQPLIGTLLSPLSIFEFPVMILIEALLMALLCATPILTAQLYSLLPSVPFVLAVFFLGHNPVLSMCLFVSCAAVSFEPLRFKSRFVAAVMCLIPSMLYWWLYSGENNERDVLRWAMLYVPWALAFLFCVLIFAIVLAIGHFVRYRPGVLMPLFGAALAGTVFLFDQEIGMHERDFQAEVYCHSPDQIPAFRSRSIAADLRAEAAAMRREMPLMSDKVLMAQLRSEWRWAFLMQMGVRALVEPAPQWEGSNPFSAAHRTASEVALARFNACDHIQNFILRHGGSARLPEAMYYQALLLDIKLDQRALWDDDIIQFYVDVPSHHSEKLWQELLERFPEAPVSIEAQWRLAQLLAGRKPVEATDTFQFAQAEQLLSDALARCRVLLTERRMEAEQRAQKGSTWGHVFTAPGQVLGDEDLAQLELRIGRLQSLIAKENRTGHLRHEERLADFVALDKRHLSYGPRLQELRRDSPQPDPLIDNIELAQAMLERNPHERGLLLKELIDKYETAGACDGRIEAMLELALSFLDQRNRSDRMMDRHTMLSESRKQLQAIIALKDDGFYAEYAQRLLVDLGALE